MFLKSSLLLTVVIGSLSLNSCTDDKKKVVEPVTASPSEAVAPGADTAGTSNLVTTPVYFGFDDYVLSSEAQSTLTSVSEGLKASKSTVIQIEGHCDERGTTEYNVALGQRRAEAVKNFLVQLGVDSARLTPMSYGEEKPAVPGHTEAEWAKNRRAEFEILKP